MELAFKTRDKVDCNSSFSPDIFLSEVRHNNIILSFLLSSSLSSRIGITISVTLEVVLIFNGIAKHDGFG